MSVYQIIQEIKSTRSRNEKESILLRNKDNEDLKTFFLLALCPFTNFYAKKEFVQEFTGNFTLSFAMGELKDKIASRQITGNSALGKIQQLLNWLSVDDAKAIMHILQKESGCELGTSTINKIWPKLIPTFPCLLATAYDDKLASKLNWSAGVISNLKSDGGRVTIVVDHDGTVKVYSRAGNGLNVFNVFDFLSEHFTGQVIDGELLTLNSDGKFNPRTTSNGIFNKCVRGTLSEEESATLHVTAWDLIQLDDFKSEYSAIPYSARFDTLKRTLESVQNAAVSLIPSRVVYSISEAQEHYQELLSEGEEGSILKDMDMVWENKRSKKQLKLKASDPGDFIITGYKAGEGKLVGNLGSLIVETSDGKLVSNMSGFSLKLRSEIWANITDAPVSYKMVIGSSDVEFFANPRDTDINIGSIIECEFNQLVKGKDSDVYSLFLPRFKQSRPDKLVPNSLSELLK